MNAVIESQMTQPCRPLFNIRWNDAPQIKSNPILWHIPIIAVTSYALSGDEAKARAAGCDGYVAKPFSPRVILTTIREFLK
jgi:CheY-like chemotaxis protein